MLPTLWQLRFQRLLWTLLVSVFGFAFILPPLFMGRTPAGWTIVVGLLLIVPGLIYTVLVTLWHWKERYRGNHSDLWGALLILETSGWFKLIYLFRHIIPDARGTGRYLRFTAMETAVQEPPTTEN